MDFLNRDISIKVFSDVISEITELFNTFLIQGTDEWFEKCFLHKYGKTYSEQFFNLKIEEAVMDVTSNITKLTKDELSEYCKYIDLHSKSISKHIINSLPYQLPSHKEDNVNYIQLYKQIDSKVWQHFNLYSVLLERSIDQLLSQYGYDSHLQNPKILTTEKIEATRNDFDSETDDVNLEIKSKKKFYWSGKIVEIAEVIRALKLTEKLKNIENDKKATIMDMVDLFERVLVIDPKSKEKKALSKKHLTDLVPRSYKLNNSLYIENELNNLLMKDLKKTANKDKESKLTKKR